MTDALNTSTADNAADSTSGRSERLPVLAFVTDAETESVLREALVEVAVRGLEVRRGNVRIATAALRKMPTPHTLIVDVSEEDQPFTALADLSEVVEPDVRVLVIGELSDVNFYRQITRGLGSLEYLYKPLTRDMVARHFGPLLSRQTTAPNMVRGGRIVTVTGARGGVGATTVAAHLAWHYGVSANHHTLLLDPDLHFGTAALLLDAKSGSGLRTALEAPQRIDELFIERSAQPISGRLHVLSGEERLTEQPVHAPGAAAKLLDAVGRRYNFVIIDVPFAPVPLHRELLDLAHQRVLVVPPTLAGARDALRLLALPNGPLQPRRALVVLNRAGMPGGLTAKQMGEALKTKIDVTIPDLPRQMGSAASMGEPASALRGGFRSGIAQLAREVAHVRMAGGAQNAPPRKRRLLGLLP